MSEEANAALMRTLFERWGASNAEVRQTFLDYFSDDCLFEQSGLPDLIGGQAACDFMDSARERGIETVEVEIRVLVAQGEWVASERVDYLKGADGTVVRSLDAVGFTRIVDGKIVAWRDYFDTAQKVAKGRS